MSVVASHSTCNVCFDMLKTVEESVWGIMTEIAQVLFILLAWVVHQGHELPTPNHLFSKVQWSFLIPTKICKVRCCDAG